MSNAVLRAIKEKIFCQISDDAAPTLVWHAGEPTTVPIAWYEVAYEELRPALPAATVFSMQSNGVALRQDWISFLLKTQTRIGLSIDGPQEFHDLRRRTRSGSPTWSLAIRALRELQAANIAPSIISVLHPRSLQEPEAYYRFYKEHHISLVNFSIDEAEGANAHSAFEGGNCKSQMIDFLKSILRQAYVDGYPLHIREIERVAGHLALGTPVRNEQVEPWDVIVVAANGDVTTFSPEFMEIRAPEYNNFCFGNVLRQSFGDIQRSASFVKARMSIELGVRRCRDTCSYFGICGGGAPSNKMFEHKALDVAETEFCKLSIQPAADALTQFLSDIAAPAQPLDSRQPNTCSTA